MIAAVIARLRSEAGLVLRTIEGGTEYAALKAPPPQAKQPAAYVFPVGDDGGSNQLVNTVRQQIRTTIGVVIMQGNLRDPRGAAAALELSDTVQHVRDVLIGWAPHADADPILFGRGRLIDITEGTLVWQEHYLTATTRRAR